MLPDQPRRAAARHVRVRDWARLVASATAAAVCSVLAYSAVGVVIADRTQGEKLAIGLPTWISECIMPVALALIEAKKEDLPPGHGLTQAKGYAACKRLNIRFVFSTNGHLFVEFDRISGLTSMKMAAPSGYAVLCEPRHKPR